jgi:hypothetical protein
VASNGRLPQAALARVKGNGWLRRDAAAAYNAMAADAARDGVDLAIWESAMRRTYRPYGAQVVARNYWCGQGRCGNAAAPGTSNHGLGICVDLMNMTQRRWIDRNGARYGWSKRWSDAPWEWWHIRYKAGIWRGRPPKSGPPNLRIGSRGIWVKRAQNALRRLNVAGAPRRVDGFYGRETANAVKRLQRKHGLTVDGRVGPQTWKILLKALK